MSFFPWTRDRAGEGAFSREPEPMGSGGTERGGSVVVAASGGIHLGVGGMRTMGFLFPRTRDRVQTGAFSWELEPRPPDILPFGDKEQE